MSNKVFVGGISWNTTNEGLAEFFSQVGNVVEAKIIFDRIKNRSKGFGFVTFSTPEEAEKAVQELNGKELDGRQLNIDIARPKEENN